MYFVLFVTLLYLSLLSPFSVSSTLHFFSSFILKFSTLFFIPPPFSEDIYIFFHFLHLSFLLISFIFLSFYFTVLLSFFSSSSCICHFFLVFHSFHHFYLSFVRLWSLFYYLIFTPSFLPSFLPITLSLFFLFPYLCSFVNLTLLLTLYKSLFFLFHLSINWRSTGICLYVYMFFFCSKVWDKNSFMQHSLTPTPPYAFSLRCELGTRHNSKYSKKNSSTKFILCHDLHRLKNVVCT